VDFPSGVQAIPFEQECLRTMDRGLHCENRIVHSSVLVSRTAIEAVGGYDESLPAATDWDLWLRIMHRFGVSSLVQVDGPLVHYRFHETNVHRNWGIMIRCERIVLQRALVRGAWGLRNPCSVPSAISEQLLREAKKYAENGLKGPAFYRTCMLVSLAPWRRWRWQRLVKLITCW